MKRLTCVAILASGLWACSKPAATVPAETEEVAENTAPANNSEAIEGDGCTEGADCCPAGDELCDLHCPSGNCEQLCAAGAECEVHCEGGSCDQVCRNGGAKPCVLLCQGGGCTQTCEGTGVCTFLCLGGGCEQKCSPENAGCFKQCPGGNCT